MKKRTLFTSLFLAILIAISLTSCKSTQKTILGFSPPGDLPSLTVEETQVVSVSEGTPDRMEFISLIPDTAWSAHPTDKYPPPDVLVEAPNALLEPFGYHLQQNPVMSSYSFQLFKDDEIIQDGIIYFHPVTVKADGSDFALPLELNTGTGSVVFFNNHSETWGSRDGYFTCHPPVFTGDVLVTVCEDGDTAAVFEGDDVVFTTPAVMMVEDPLKNLYSWQGQWILEVEGKVFVSGKSLNDELGYAEIFNFDFIDGQPFFFFTKEAGGTVGVSYGFQELSQTYTQVVHYQCCEPAAFNPASTANMIWFFALKDGFWNYVTMGVYK